MLVLVALASGLCPSVQEASPRVPLRGSIECASSTEGARHVLVRRLAERADGRLATLGKRELYALATEPAHDADADGAFELVVAAGHYALFAYVDVDGDGLWTPSVPEPCGWLDDVTVPPEGARDVRVLVRAPRPLERSERDVEHGALRWQQGLPVVRLRGDAEERGRAHGALLAPQIVDFFRFYILEDRLRSADAYREFEAFLETSFAWPTEMLREVDGVLAGMLASGVDLALPELERDFSRTDLLAINAYIETRAMRSSCTQFACWGARTAGTDVDGGMLAGRNMDGEIDLRRVTVSHFVLFAVEPTEPGAKRYVSLMWPGFVGTITGFNEDGVHCMENAGGTGPGPVVERLQPIAWTMRDALATLGADARPVDFERLLSAAANSAGGACGPGCIVLLARPVARPEAAGDAPLDVPAWVLEGDRFGHASRLPAAVEPRLADALLASNHHLVYGASPAQPGASFGREPSFSSAWRYEAGRRKLEAWARVGRTVGTLEMRELLQTVAHGTTEHSVITRPNARTFDVAVASLEPEPWDAPYRAWVTFGFEELFADSPPATAGTVPTTNHVR